VFAEEEILKQRQKMYEALGYSEGVASTAYPIEVCRPDMFCSILKK